MSKIIDTFLFFQELDLLELRLAYLDPFVDKFVIVEACQTFSGKPKEFVFEANSKRFEKYLDKITYIQITDFHHDYNSVIEFLAKAGTPSHLKVRNILENHLHYSKKELNWVLDSYHRECIHLALDRIANDDDIVILSDLDEIPSLSIFSEENLMKISKRPRVCGQHEFRYFLNFYKDSAWLGTIVGVQKVMGMHSLNMLRIDSKEIREIVHPDVLPECGYHFTSCGGIEAVRKKIESWGHQELNNSTVIKNIEKNMMSGQDIFFRDVGTTLEKIEADDMRYYDSEIIGLMACYPQLIATHRVDAQVTNGFWQRLIIKWHKAKYKLRILLQSVRN